MSDAPARDTQIAFDMLDRLDTDDTAAGLAELTSAGLDLAIVAEELATAALEQAETAPDSAAYLEM